MISDGSYDTEDWSNDAENSALHHRNKLNLNIYSNRKPFFLIVIIFHNITVFFQHFLSNKCSLGEHKSCPFFLNGTKPKHLKCSVYGVVLILDIKNGKYRFMPTYKLLWLITVLFWYASVKEKICIYCFLAQFKPHLCMSHHISAVSHINRRAVHRCHMSKHKFSVCIIVLFLWGVLSLTLFNLMMWASVDLQARPVCLPIKAIRGIAVLL